MAGGLSENAGWLSRRVQLPLPEWGFLHDIRLVVLYAPYEVHRQHAWMGTIDSYLDDIRRIDTAKISRGHCSVEDEHIRLLRATFARCSIATGC